MAEAPETIAQSEDDTFAPEETISDALPPQVVNPALTGRIRPEWRDGKKRYVDFDITLKEVKQQNGER
jgi:hypothetical protein